MTLLKYFKSGTITVKKGEAIEIPAEVIGIPMPKSEWSRDGNIIEDQTENFLINTEVLSYSKAHTTLSIPETDRKDSGLYTLAASNHLGSAYQNIKVEIFGKCYIFNLSVYILNL